MLIQQWAFLCETTDMTETVSWDFYNKIHSN